MPKRKMEKSFIELFYEYGVYIPTRTIYIGDESVCYSLAEKTIKSLHLLSFMNKEPVNVILDSTGGDEYYSFAIYDALRHIKNKVHIKVFGEASSAGSIILQAGDKRLLSVNTTLLLHDGTWEYSGEAKNAEKWGEEGKRVRKLMYKIYYNRIKEVKQKITMYNVEQMCLSDNFITAKDAVKIGLADDIMYEKNFIRKKK